MRPLRAIPEIAKRVRPDCVAVVSRERAADPLVVARENVEMVVPEGHDLLVELRLAVRGADHGCGDSLVVRPRLFLRGPRAFRFMQRPRRLDRCIEKGQRPHFIHGGPIAHFAVWCWLAIACRIFDLQLEGAQARVKSRVAPALGIELPPKPRRQPGPAHFNSIFVVRRVAQARQGKVQSFHVQINRSDSREHANNASSLICDAMQRYCLSLCNFRREATKPYAFVKS